MEIELSYYRLIQDLHIKPALLRANSLCKFGGRQGPSTIETEGGNSFFSLPQISHARVR